MTSRQRRSHPGFSLVELLTVITIMVLLAGMIIAGLGFVNDRQARSKAQVQIKLLEKGIQEYQSDMGAFPGTQTDTPIDGDVSEQLYQALFYDGYDYTRQTTPPTAWTKATKIYAPDLDPSVTNQGWISQSKSAAGSISKDLKIKDPWGNNYRYRKGSNAQNVDFDLWSVGKDGKTNTGTLDHKDNKDDVRNF